MAEDPSLLEFVVASADHQDALFRLVQYVLKFVGTMGEDRRRRATLSAIAGAMDSARMLTRTFGTVYALQAVMSPWEAPTATDRLANWALLAYHPLETWYWLLTAARSRNAKLVRLVSRLSCAMGLLWSACRSIATYRQLRELQHGVGGACLESCPSPSARYSGDRDQPDNANATNRTEVGTQAEDSDGKAEEGQMAAGATVSSPQTGRRKLREQLTKLLLDSVLSLHWTLAHPIVALSERQVGIVGIVSALLGIRLQWRALFLDVPHPAPRLLLEESSADADAQSMDADADTDT